MTGGADWTGMERRLLSGEPLPFEQARYLMTLPEGHPEASELLRMAGRVREAVHGNRVELCSIQNARSGRCTEDCRFCAQSSHYDTAGPVHELLDAEEILTQARRLESEGVHRFSLVISGHRVEPSVFEGILQICRRLSRSTGLKLCASLGAISVKQATELKDAGVSRYHHNLETSEAFYPNVCSTHTYQERLDTLAACRLAGLSVCSGGIIGLGESSEDRLELAYTLRNQGVLSIPLNVLVAIPGTPLEKQTPLQPFEILKTGAVFRLINPHAVIRYAGGRSLLGDAFTKGLRAGISGLLTGNLLTTAGQGVRQDVGSVMAAGYAAECLL